MVNEISVTFRVQDDHHIPVAILHDDQIRIDIEIPMYRYSVPMEYFEPISNADDDGDGPPSFEKVAHPDLEGYLQTLAHAVRSTIAEVQLADRVSPEATIQFPLPRLMQFITGVSGTYSWSQ